MKKNESRYFNTNKQWMKTVFFVIMLILCINIQVTAFDLKQESDNPVIEKLENGSIDWSGGIIKVKGVGFSSENVKKAKKKSVALAEAQADAYRNLANIVIEVRLDSELTVKNLVNEFYNINTQIAEFIKHAKMIGQPKYLNDSDGTVEVEMAINIYGTRGLFNILKDKLFEKKEIHSVYNTEPTPSLLNILTPSPIPLTSSTINSDSSPLPPEQSPPTPLSVSPSLAEDMSSTSDNIMTGVIIDCRKSGIRPSICPSIIDTQGEKIYVENIPIDPDFVINTGIVGYTQTIETAQKNIKRIGTSPLMLKGIKASGQLKADIVISDSDAKLLQKADSAGRFLQNASVIILL